MAMLPASILKQLTAIAKDRTEKVKSVTESSNDSQVLIKAHEKTGNYYLTYNDAIRSFLIAGYSEKIAMKHIDSWRDYDLIDIWYLDKYKLIGFNAHDIERLAV